jgi:hypothetical protein
MAARNRCSPTHVGPVPHGGEEPLLTHAISSPFLAAGRDDEEPARLDNRRWREEEIRGSAAGLVEVGVLGEAHSPDGYVVLVGNVHLVDGAGERYQLLVCLHWFACLHTDDPLLVVQHHVEDEAQAHRHCLAPAGVASVLVGLHQPGTDQQVGLHHRPVGRDRHSAGGDSQVHQRPGVLRLVVNDLVAGDHLRPQFGDPLLWRAGPVHTDAAEEGDILVVDSSRFQFS